MEVHSGYDLRSTTPVVEHNSLPYFELLSLCRGCRVLISNIDSKQAEIRWITGNKSSMLGGNKSGDTIAQKWLPVMEALPSSWVQITSAERKLISICLW
jgi:hypothetical protein